MKKAIITTLAVVAGIIIIFGIITVRDLKKYHDENTFADIEVKAEENLRSKSLRTIFEENNRLRPCRFSMANYREQDWMINVPLYLAREWMNNAE